MTLATPTDIDASAQVSRGVGVHEGWGMTETGPVGSPQHPWDGKASPLQLVDRAKDLGKSGGEWNSSVDLEEIPKTSVSKFSKKELRAQFEDYKLPTA